MAGSRSGLPEKIGFPVVVFEPEKIIQLLALILMMLTVLIAQWRSRRAAERHSRDMDQRRRRRREREAATAAAGAPPATS